MTQARATASQNASPLTLTTAGFAELFGTTPDHIPEACLQKIAQNDWGYEIIGGQERDDIVIDILSRIEERKLAVVANEDNSRWVKGWGENLAAFREQKGDTQALTPKYIRAGQPVRLFGEFVRTNNPKFEEHWYSIFREWFFRTYLHGFDNIFEFGCGSGFNVATLAAMYPQSAVCGLDWAQPSVDIVNEMRGYKNLNVRGHLFDFFHPDESLDVPANSAVLTVGAIEQTDTKWGDYLDFLLRKKPCCVFHIEPVYEWYDPTRLVDFTAIRAHLSRNFCTGYWAKLVALEQEGKIKILRQKRTGFGSLVIEGYSQIIWAPV